MKFITVVLFLVCFAFSGFGQEKTVENFSDISELERINCSNPKQFIPDNLANILAEAIARQPQNARLYIARAYCYLAFKNYPAYLNDVKTVLKLLPKHESDYDFYETRLKNLAFPKGNNSDGNIKFLSSLIEEIPNHFFLYIIRAEIKRNSADYYGSYQDYLKAIETDSSALTFRPAILDGDLIVLFGEPNDIEYYTQAIEIYDKHIKKLTSEIQQNPQDQKKLFRFNRWIEDLGAYAHEFSILLVKMYERTDDTKNSEAVLEKMVTIEPRIRAFETRAYFYKERKLFQKAQEDKRRANELRIEQLTNAIDSRKINIIDMSVELYLKRGDIYVELGEFEKAIADYQLVKTINPNLSQMIDKRIASAYQK